MATETAQIAEPSTDPLRKRKAKRNSKAKKRMKPAPQYQGTKPKARETKKTRRVLRKRAREYNSDDNEEDDDEIAKKPIRKGGVFEEEEEEEWDGADVEEEDEGKGSSSEEDEGDGMQHEVAKFTEGCRAFKVAFLNIMKSKTSDVDPLGPVLSAHKKLVAEKLAEEAEDQKAKGEARKERRSAGEKGHTEPLKYLDSKEKFLISVATKGVVKLFNAVSKAQKPQKISDSSESRDAKELAKRRKEAFFSEIRKPTMQNKSEDGTNNEEPGWAPLRDDYMLTSSRLKDWDKMEDAASINAPQKTPLESSSDEE